MTSSQPFDEELLSGYLDGALNQAESQKVRLCLENDAEARALFEEMKTLRAATSSTRFKAPDDDAWPELPHTLPGKATRPLGWIVLTAWLLVVGSLALWRFLTASGSPLEIFLTLGLPGGLVLLFVSVLSDRLRELKSDRYRGVKR